MNHLIYTVPFEISARGPEALRAYQRALKDGKTCDRSVPIMIVGQDRSGKTSLKKSLKGDKFNPNEDSTFGIEVDPSLCQITTEAWKVKESQNEKVAMEGKFAHHAARLTQRNLVKQQSGKENYKRQLHHDEPVKQKRQRKESISHSKVFHTRKDTREETLADTNKPLNDKLVNAKNEMGAVPINNNMFAKLPATAEHKDKSMGKVFTMPEEVQKLLNAKFEAMGDDDAINFTLWDFAGQSLFYTTHVLFLSRLAIYLLTHDLSEELDAKAVPLVKCGMYERREDTECETTNMDYIHYWLSSIHSLSHDPELPPSKEAHLPSKLPAVFLVCTHADKPASGTNPKQVASKIMSNLEGKSYVGHLVREIFTVDNTQSGSVEGEDEEVKRLRQMILQLAKQLPHVKEYIPLR